MHASNVFQLAKTSSWYAWCSIEYNKQQNSSENSLVSLEGKDQRQDTTLKSVASQRKENIRIKLYKQF